MDVAVHPTGADLEGRPSGKSDSVLIESSPGTDRLRMVRYWEPGGPLGPIEKSHGGLNPEEANALAFKIALAKLRNHRELIEVRIDGLS